MFTCHVEVARIDGVFLCVGTSRHLTGIGHLAFLALTWQAERPRPSLVFAITAVAWRGVAWRGVAPKYETTLKFLWLFGRAACWPLRASSGFSFLPSVVP